MTRKGQITLEALLLYGVAILIVLLAVGALTYFGVLDLGRLLPDRCNLASSGSLSCDGWSVSSSGMQLGLKNIGATALDVSEVAFYPDGATRSDPTQYCIYDATHGSAVDVNQNPVSEPAKIMSGSNVAFTLQCGSQAIQQSSGQKVRGDLEIVFKDDGSAVTNSVGGQLVASVS